MSDKMYAEFESWWYASKYCQVVNSSENAKQTAWDGWKASREMLVIELPKGDSLARRMYGPQACGANPLISRFDAVEFIEAAGLKVANQ